MSFLRHLRSTPVKLCAVVVGASLLMGQGCPPTDGGGGTPEPTQRQFVGATDCRICHSRVYDTWSQTAHAGALETLKAIGQGENTNCIGCHTVGYGQEGGYTSEAETPQLAGVQCENCHGAGLDHRSNVNVASLRPSTSIAATVCGNCHNGFHHPTYDEWHSTNHSRVEPDVAASLTQGRSANSCGVCHSGDYRKERFINGNTSVPDTLLAGVAPDEMNAVTCAICHDPHMQTGNDAIPEAGHDKQLRYPEVSTPDQANTVAAVMDTTRFNVCGQCHHDRGRVWTATSRGTHPSNQVNMYLGEMPVPDGITLLLPNERTVHRFVPKQCVTCHMVHTDAVGEEQPAHTGHGLDIDFTGCSTSAAIRRRRRRRTT